MITSSKEIVPNELIVIYSNGEMIDSIYSDQIGKFSVLLEFGERYFFVIGKDKFKIKWIEISTEIPLEYRKENHKVLFYIDLEPVKALSTLTSISNNDSSDVKWLILK